MNKWSGKSKGTLLGYKVFIYTIKLFGIIPAYFVLLFVSTYYFVFHTKTRKILVRFYSIHLGFNKLKSYLFSYKNIYVFGQTLIDKMAFQIKLTNRFSMIYENEQFLVDLKNNKKGAILLSGHVGNWESAALFLKSRITSNIHVVMYDAEYQKIKSYLERETGGKEFQIIAIKDDLSHVIKIHNALSNNDFVAIHADRYLEGTKTIELTFLGKKALFPYGPFLIASKFNVPVTFVFCTKKNAFKYHFSCTFPIENNHSPEEYAELFVKELEKRVNLYPEQWFNYFEFFNE